MQYKTTKKGRYKGYKSKFWDIFSDFIRLRDFLKYGTCITCGKKFATWNDGSQAGHFLAAGNCGFSLLFDEMNINSECSYDNAFNKNHQITMRENMVTRYGEKYVTELEERYKLSHFGGQTMKEWNKREYEMKTAEYKEKVLEMVTQLNSI
jgi:hypothetical protein